MSNVYDLGADLDQERQAARAATVGYADADPEKAARALTLSKVNGIPASLLIDDIDELEKQEKANVSAELVGANPSLATYVASDPMAPRISNDDYGNLDAVSESVGKLTGTKGFLSALNKALEDSGLYQPAGSWMLRDEKSRKWVAENPLGSAGWAVLGLPVEAGMGILTAGVTVPVYLLAEGYRQLTGDERATRVGEQMNAALQDPGLLASLGLPIANPMAMVRPINPRTGVTYTRRDAVEFNRSFQEAVEGAGPWVQAGVEPPRYLHPELDNLKAAQNDFDLDLLTDATRDAQKSATRERSPEMFADFIRQHGDATISIDADAVRALYGDKPPALDDNILGWVPRIKEQLDAAWQFGGDIEIPLSEWLARVDPQMMQVFKDDIRVRPGNITKREAELGKEPAPFDGIVSADPVDNLRTASRLDPLLSLEEKLRMSRAMDPELVELAEQIGAESKRPTHPFVLVDQKGEPAVQMIVSEYDGGKSLFVEDIRAMIENLNYGVGSFGPALMRDVLRQIKQQFPQAEKISGYRVSGAREAAGSVMETNPATGKPYAHATTKLDQGEWEVRLDSKTMDAIGSEEWWESLLTGGRWEKFGGGLEAYILPAEQLKPKQRELSTAILEELKRIAPDAIASPAGRIKVSGQEVAGAFLPLTKSTPIILWSLESLNPARTARHEAIHYLREMGLFSKEEWNTLVETAKTEDWLGKFKIERRYAHEPEAIKFEEAIADAYASWKTKQRPVDGTVAAIFEKLQAFLEALSRRVKEVLGIELTADDLFKGVDMGEIGARDPRREFRPELAERTGLPLASVDEQGRPIEGRLSGSRQPIPGEKKPTTATQLEFLETTRMEDRSIFERAAAIGMTEAQYKRYLDLIDKRAQQDLEAMNAKVQAEVQRRQTDEWKAAERAVREEVVKDINNRPDVAADNFLREGVLYGEKQEGGRRPTLDVEYLTPEQREGLPEYYQSKTGARPDDIAQIFGFRTGGEMVDALIAMKAEQGTQRWDAYKRKMIQAEVDRRMAQSHGSLRENILEEVKDRTLSEVQLDMLHEEVYALATKAGAQYSITKEQLKSWAIDKLHESGLGTYTSDKLLQAAGKTGRAAELALLKEDFQGAFLEKQRQQLAVIMAKEMRTVERQQQQFKRLVRRYTPREVKTIDADFVDYIQLLLTQVGVPVRRAVPEIYEHIRSGPYPTFDRFVGAKQGEGWDIFIPHELAMGPPKKLQEMSVGEFLDFKMMLDSLNNAGRREKQITVAGQQITFEDFKADVLKNIQSLPATDPNRKWSYARQFETSLTRMEEVMKDLDLRKELGPLFNAVIRPMMESKAAEYTKLEKLTEDFKKLRGFGKEWRKTLDDTIPQTFLIDPETGTPFDLNREQMINLMLNFGNRSNIEKLTKGFIEKGIKGDDLKAAAGIMEARLVDLFNRYATKEDIDFVNAVWKTADFRSDIMKLSRDMGGIPPKMIENSPINLSAGQLNGGYFPIIFDPRRSNINVIKERTPGDALFGPDYFRASTPHGYAVERTGYVDFIDFQAPLDQLALRLQQTIHDITHREAVMQVGKVIYDKEIRQAIRKHYGQEYEAQLTPWLRDIANHFNVDEQKIGGANALMRRARMNLVASALGLNLKVILSPSLGTLTPVELGRAGKRMMNFFGREDEFTKLAMSKSLELPHTLQNMDRDLREKLEQLTNAKGWDAFQAEAVRFTFGPMLKVEQSLRIETWVAKYEEAKKRGVAEDDAIALADSEVRTRHGSAGAADLAPIMRSSEAMKIATLFYGYFNMSYNQLRQVPGNVKRGEYLAAAGNAWAAVLSGAVFGALFFTKKDKDDTTFDLWAKALTSQVAGMIPFGREAASFFVEGQQPRTPLESVMTAVGSSWKDIQRSTKGQATPKAIAHGMSAAGLVFGVPGAGQIGRSSQFIYDVRQGKQRPRNILEWANGIIHGEAQPRAR